MPNATAGATTEPYDSGFLPVHDGQLVYYEQCGNPAGKPLLFLHGGPGSGCSVGHRRTADPQLYRAVLFDQRGCGRSRPHAGDLETSLDANRTQDLIDDIERLRIHLGIDRWLVFGGSWGTTLALAYAQQHPDRVTEIVLVAVFLSRRDEIAWLYGGLGRFLPAEHQAFRAAVPPGLRDGDLVAVYNELLNARDQAIRQRAADAWISWEDAVISLDPVSNGPSLRRLDPRYRLAFARICAHYFSHGAWLAENQLIDQIDLISSIPAVLIHGRVDPQGPLSAAWELHQAWPASQLVVVDHAGHSSTALGDAIGPALARFSQRP